MSERSSRSSHSTKLSPKATVLAIGLLVGYVLLQPTLERWTGLELPSLTGQPEQFEQPEKRPDVVVPPIGEGTSAASPADSLAVPESATADASAAADARSESGSSTELPPVPRLGELRDIGGGVFQSTAGLMYRRGSQEGHRIKHILRHHADDPDRPVHGVFDGDRNEVFAVIDEAYLYTFDHGPPRVKTEKEEGRTIYVVDLGRRIGYVGGEKGRRNDHPAANHLQLIVEGTNVITAYPVRVDRRR